MGYIDEPIKGYLNDLAAKKPAPGGGSAAALAAGLGTALILMALRFTVGKDAYKKFEEELTSAISDLEKIKDSLSSLVDEDVIAYNKLRNAQKGGSDKDFSEAALVEAIGVPLKVLNLCYNATEICSNLTRKTNPNLISDIGCGALFLDAAFFAAKFNIEINLKSVQDKFAIEKLRRDMALKEQDMQKMKKNILDDTRKIM